MITGLFDVNPRLIGTSVRGIPIYSMEQLPELWQAIGWILQF